MIKVYEKDGFTYFEFGSHQIYWENELLTEENQETIARSIEMLLNNVTGSQDSYFDLIDHLSKGMENGISNIT